MRTEGGGIVQVAIDKIINIANTTISRATDDASTTSGDFRNLSVPGSSWSEVPLAQALARQHKSAHDVFVETINGVVADLEEFRDSLHACAKGHESNDDAVAAALLAMNRRYDGKVYQGETKYQKALDEHADELRDAPPAAPADHGREATPPASESGHPANGADAAGTGTDTTAGSQFYNPTELFPGFESPFNDGPVIVEQSPVDADTSGGEQATDRDAF